MDLIISGIAFVVIFSLIILIHEFGHFYMARRAGIKVEEFGIGLPPRIWGKKFKKNGILWSINWIPFGGFVRLYGEDATDEKMIKDNKSFASKPLRKRMAVVVAGVFMNFLLAFVLLVIGFTAGIQPLIVNSDDVLSALDSGIIELGYDKDLAKPLSAEEREMEQIINLPRVVIREVEEGSDSKVAGLEIDDVILKMNGENIYWVSDFQTIINSQNKIDFEILRDFEPMNITVDFSTKQRVIIANVVPEAPASKAGFQEGDIVLSINDEPVYIAQDSINMTAENIGKNLTYKIDRNGEELEIVVAPSEEGRIGVGIITMTSYKNNQLSVYNRDVPAKVIKINDVQYPFHQAIGQAWNECGRLALLTVDMFGNLVKSIFSKFTVPEGVAGPVGIATMTHMFVQEGLLALLRFTALLSLSLAVINIIPFPALDGGRLLFLLVEAVRGKRIPAKWEALIHAFGFILLIGLIFFITYSDILNIFS
ncbi:RIP metalloprotease RseP [Patescibacteria group bacterium]